MTETLDAEWAPAGIPVTVADKLAKDVARALASPDLREQLIKLGGELMSMTPDEYARFVRNEVETSARIVKAARIKPQQRQATAPSGQCFTSFPATACITSRTSYSK